MTAPSIEHSIFHLSPITGLSDLETKELLRLASGISGNILEIGTQFGVTTRHLALAFRDRLVFSVDYISDTPTMPVGQAHEMPTLDTVGIWVRGLQNVFLSLQDSKTFDYTGKNIGFVFVDGDHSYRGVEADTMNAIRSVKLDPRPLRIVWHDYYEHDWVDVKRYVDGIGNKFGKIQFIPNTCLAYLDVSL